jgi:uncharacterized protein with von Willebrand factor type A (vWA) domain
MRRNRTRTYGRDVTDPSRRHRGFRYGPWRGGPDPLAPPYDLRNALDALGEEVLSGGSLREALREMLRRGLPDEHSNLNRQGLDDLLARAARMRREAARRGRLDGAVARAAAQLDQALATERAALAETDGDDARFAEARLDALPRSTAAAVQELADYRWTSPDAERIYREILDGLRRDVLDNQFRGLRDALSRMAPGNRSGPQRRQGQGDDGGRGDDGGGNGDDGDKDRAAANRALKDMLADLNHLLGKHARGEDTAEDFRQFMDSHGDLFGENPENVDELIDALARRAAAGQRLMASLTPQQREELQSLMSQALADADLAAELAALTDNLRTLRPDLTWERGERTRGENPLGYGEATGVLSELADLDDLIESLGQEHPGATLDDIDVETVERALGPAAARDVAELQRLERELERQGWLTRGADGLQLSAKALRRLGQTALRKVFEQLSTRGRGDHDERDAGAAGELTGASRAWEFGDEQPLDVVRTVGNAVRRQALPTPAGHPHGAHGAHGAIVHDHEQTGHEQLWTPDSPGAPDSPVIMHDRARTRVRLTVEDFEVAETERRASAAVALCVDLSYSMVAEGRWGPMKQTALALAHLVATKYPQDALQIVGFGRYANRLSVGDLAAVEPDYVQGTNLQHALRLAGRHLRRHPDGEPVVLVVTDGEPTAHLTETGGAVFSWPPTRDTVTATVAEVDGLTRFGAAINIFMLGEDPGLRRFVDAVARRNGGRVFTPTGDRLGRYVVAEYLRARQGRRRG